MLVGIRNRIIYWVTTVAVLLGMAACGTNKNTPGSRAWQAFNTRYNVYYNGKTHYDEQLQEMERA